uniref:Uncharacterized protein n=1 Tax=Coccidioides posadasii RMSCC 3488 TaxID=454284 RepID=A0A0J6INL2_COCPO|nr:hypothetical protein CPAG_09795 [Coccidioides posadasii RMSCC 3488]
MQTNSQPPNVHFCSPALLEKSESATALDRHSIPYGGWRIALEFLKSEPHRRVSYPPVTALESLVGTLSRNEHVSVVPNPAVVTKTIVPEKTAIRLPALVVPSYVEFESKK